MVIWVLLLYCLLSMISASNHQVLVESFTWWSCVAPSLLWPSLYFSPILPSWMWSTRFLLLSFLMYFVLGFPNLEAFQPKPAPKMDLCDHLPLPTSNQPRKGLDLRCCRQLPELAVSDSTQRDMANYRGKRALHWDGTVPDGKLISSHRDETIKVCKRCNLEWEI